MISKFQKLVKNFKMTFKFKLSNGLADFSSLIYSHSTNNWSEARRAGQKYESNRSSVVKKCSLPLVSSNIHRMWLCQSRFLLNCCKTCLWPLQGIPHQYLSQEMNDPVHELLTAQFIKSHVWFSLDLKCFNPISLSSHSIVF